MRLMLSKHLINLIEAITEKAMRLMLSKHLINLIEAITEKKISESLQRT
jgi:hypothetical protein